MTKDSPTRAHLLLFLVALIYGANYSIAKLIMDPGFIPPNTFILLRVGVALLLFLIFFGKLTRIERSDWGSIVLLSLSGVVVNQLLFFNGLHRTSPIHAALIMVTTPILVLLLQVSSGVYQIRLRNWIGCLLGFIGTTLLILQSNRSNVHRISSIEGDLMIFINACSYAVYLNKAPELMKRYQAMEILKWIFAIGFVGCIPVGLQGFAYIPWHSFEAVHWLSLIFVLVATTFLAYLWNAKALQISSPSLVSTYIYLQPIIAMAIAILVKKDSLDLEVLGYGIASMYGVYLASGLKIKLP